MKTRNLLLNFTVAISALFFGLLWVGIYQFFVEKTLGEKVRPAIVNKLEQPKFDINNPESVLPINFEEDKLSDPKEDENNPKYFDPEGYYYFDNDPKDFNELFYIVIHNKNFGVPRDSREYGEVTTSPKGHIIIQREDKPQYIDFEYLKIENSKLEFRTKPSNGISYEFDGNYLIKGNFYTLEVDAKVLTGTLIKKDNGKEIAKDEFNFNWKLEIECLH